MTNKQFLKFNTLIQNGTTKLQHTHLRVAADYGWAIALQKALKVKTPITLISPKLPKEYILLKEAVDDVVIYAPRLSERDQGLTMYKQDMGWQAYTAKFEDIPDQHLYSRTVLMQDILYYIS